MQITPEQKQYFMSLLRAWYPDWQGVSDPKFVKDEIDYKRKAAAEAQQLLAVDALRPLLDSGDVDGFMVRVDKAAKLSNLLERRYTSSSEIRILAAPGLDKPAFCRAIFDLLHGEGDSPERLGRYAAWVSGQGLPNGWGLPTVLLFYLDPSRELHVKTSPFDWMVKQLDPSFKRSSFPSAESYAKARDVGRTVSAAFSAEGAADMIDAHSIIWTCGKVALAQVVSEQKEAEFGELFQQFLSDYPQSADGQNHIRNYRACRMQGVANFEQIVQAQARGEDVTDLVLLKLLPYADTERNRAAGAWVHLAPAINGNLKLWYESRTRGTVKREDWPGIAAAILRFVQRCQAKPRDLKEAIAEFQASGLSTGFQTGQLTPILNALRPDDYHLINNKSRKVINFLAAKSLDQNLSDYPAANALFEKVLHDLEGSLAVGESLGLPPPDLFDMFCHWLVAVKGHPLEDTQFWAIEAGAQGEKWQLWREEGFVAIGWEKLGDLSGVKRPEFDARVKDLAAPPDRYSTQGTAQVWTFARSIREGDRVVAKRGTQEVLGVGTVTGGYEFAEGEEYAHRLPVIWDDLSPRAVNEPSWIRSLHKLDHETFERVRNATPAVDVPPPPPPPVAGCPFSQRTFELLAGIHNNPTVAYYEANAADFALHIEEPFKRVIRSVAERLDPRIRQVMETKSRIFARFRKNDYGRGGTWDYFWSGFYPKGGKRAQDVQLSAWMNYEFFEYGFYFGDSAVDGRKLLLRNVQAHGPALREIMEELIPSDTVFFGNRDDYVLGQGQPLYKDGNPRTWADWMADPQKFYLDASFAIPKTELLALDEESLVERIRKGHEALYPLVLLALLDDPMPAIKAWLGITDDDEEDETPAPYTMANFLARTYLTPETAEEMVSLLRERKQLLFYGPPGTGKTWVAQELGKLLTGLDEPPRERLETVQFHPAYGYEDFIEGIRPVSMAGENGTHVVDYPTRAGSFKRFCQQAALTTEPCVFIIDEINRGNIPRIFGELMYLLEYREKPVRLPYSGEPFTIPQNVYIIGTMNTADRSIALVDFALRRRFHFFHFKADPELFARWHAANGLGIPWLTDLYRALCELIKEEDYRIGPSHFMHKDLTEEKVRRTWKRSIEPYLEEYYFDNGAMAKGWGWEEKRVRDIRLGAEDPGVQNG